MSSFKSDFLAGVRECIPPTLSAIPFGLLFGALAIDHGLSHGEAVLMSATIFGGASQMVGIDLFRSNVAAWLIVFSIFAVNFRHILYSASIGRGISHFSGPQKALAYFLLVDPVYAASEIRIEQGKTIPPGWYFGMGLFMYVCWNAATLLGAMFGQLIRDPETYGIDFLLPVYFLGLLLGFRKRPNWMPVVIAASLGSIAAYLTVGSPWHVGLGAIAGIIAAVVIPLDKTPKFDPVPPNDGPEDMG